MTDSATAALLKEQLEAEGIDVHARFSDKHNKNIQQDKEWGLIKNAKDISDGYHTFSELYEVRAVLNIALFKQIHGRFFDDWRHSINYNKWQGHSAKDAFIASSANPIWRSKLHSDGSMFDGMFIFGFCTEPGEQITFHYHLDKWNDCDFAQTLEKAPEWDGHTPADVLERLKAL